MKQLKPIQVNEEVSFCCDTSGQKSLNGELEFYEFISVNHHCESSSIHGDGNANCHSAINKQKEVSGGYYVLF